MAAALTDGSRTPALTQTVCGAAVVSEQFQCSWMCFCRVQLSVSSARRVTGWIRGVWEVCERRPALTSVQRAAEDKYLSKQPL